jgi:CRISPR/Cas system-associated endonuclease Cas1
MYLFFFSENSIRLLMPVFKGTVFCINVIPPCSLSGDAINCLLCEFIIVSLEGSSKYPSFKLYYHLYNKEIMKIEKAA